MQKNVKFEILKNTCLALAAGLFTGGIVTSFVLEKSKMLDLLRDAYMSALVFYYFYVTINVFEKNEEESISKWSLFIISFFIFIIWIVLRWIKN